MTLSTATCQSTNDHSLPCNCVVLAAAQNEIPAGHSFEELSQIYNSRGNNLMARHYARLASEMN